ncbi:amino acid adenylation domain-containing protein, partial [Chitinophaga sp. Cy-1792]|uniref:amino acid adenylation domain-containing protein n=1 Tax=Chitinophaga sp. Cy-1792 TaxID=2608339 RepID=UPI001421BC59
RMVLCHKDDIGAPERLRALIARHQVSCLHFVPGMFNAFITTLFEEEDITAALSSLRLIVTSGEALSAETVRSWYERMTTPVHNLYGPTEASVDVTYYATRPGDQRIPIGRPIWNTQLYILGADNSVQPIGVTGEICIGGDGLARGYLNKPALTAEKFVAHPFEGGRRIYRTGDIGRWLPDGNIEYLGRIDDQVKIRGYRIELGEIATVLHGHPDIDAAVVIAKADQTGTLNLVGYFIGKKPIALAELRQWLGSSLPAYMIPAYFVQLDSFPLNANGKVDRRQLPAPEDFGLSSGTTYIPARNNIEAQLIAIWEQV